MWHWGIAFLGITLLIGIAGDWTWGGMVASLAILLTILWQLGRRALVTVPEETLAVIIDQDQDRFIRLLPPGRHRMRPFLESVDAFIPSGTESASGRCQAYSDGGLPLRLQWLASYQLEPQRMPAPDQARLVRKLARKHERILEIEATAALQHALSATALNDLLGSGGRSRLERQARDAAAVELARLGINLKRIRIVDLDLPPDVQASLAEAHERAVQAESQASALARLQAVIGQFSEQEMQRLTELERLRLLGQNGMAYGWPQATVIDIPGPSRRKPDGVAAWN